MSFREISRRHSNGDEKGLLLGIFLDAAKRIGKIFSRRFSSDKTLHNFSVPGTQEPLAETGKNTFCLSGAHLHQCQRFFAGVAEGTQKHAEFIPPPLRNNRMKYFNFSKSI